MGVWLGRLENGVEKVEDRRRRGGRRATGTFVEGRLGVSTAFAFDAAPDGGWTADGGRDTAWKFTTVGSISALNTAASCSCAASTARLQTSPAQHPPGCSDFPQTLKLCYVRCVELLAAWVSRRHVALRFRRRLPHATRPIELGMDERWRWDMFFIASVHTLMYKGADIY
jgi:hypothetical protein